MNEGILKELAIRLGVIERTLRRAHTTPAGGGFKPDPGGSGMTPTGDIHLYGAALIYHDVDNTYTVGTITGATSGHIVNVPVILVEATDAGNAANRAVELYASRNGTDAAGVAVEGGTGASAPRVRVVLGSNDALTVEDGAITVGSDSTSTALPLIATGGGIRTRVSAGAPGGGADGDIAIDSSNNRLYVYYSGGWHYATLT